MLIISNCNIVLSSDIIHNKYVILKGKNSSISFYEDGKIEHSGFAEDAALFLFDVFFKDNFLNKKYDYYDSETTTTNINNCIIINAYERTIKYIGNFYSKMPQFLKLLEENLQIIKKLQAFS